MRILICFLLFASGLYLGYEIYYGSIIFVLLLLGLTLYLYKKQGLKYLIFIGIGFFITFISKLISKYCINGFYVVIKAESNYVLVSNFLQTYYLKIYKNTLEIGDILQINGQLNELRFSTYQEGFDFVKYLNSKGCFYQIQGDYEIRFSNFIRLNAFQSYLLNSYSDESKNIIGALFLKNSFSNLDSYRDYSLSGISYLISGTSLHLSYLNSLIRKLLHRKIKDKYIDILLIITIFIFYILSSYSIGILRILIFNSISCISRKKRIDVCYLSKLGFSMFIICFLNPFYVIGSGFAYTFVILFLLHLFTSKLNHLNKLNKVYIKLYIILILLPLNLMNNYGINILALILQAILPNVFSLLFAINLLVFFGPISSPFLNVLNKAVSDFINFIIKQKILLVTGEINILFVLLLYIILFLIFYFKDLKFNKYFKILSIVFIGLFSINFVPNIFPYYSVTFINVNQGDSTLIRYKDKNILIDTGGSNYFNVTKDCLMPYFNKLKIRKLDALFITHEDNDHIGGLFDLKENIQIDNLYLNGLTTSIKIDDLEIKDLNQYKDSGEDENYNSSVFYFEMFETKFLIMGDAPKEIEKKIIEDNKDLKADVIKLGHHGSSTSSDEEFLKQVNPKLAIISCGYNNIYGHPTNEVLTTLNNLDINYCRTDISSSITYDVRKEIYILDG